MKIQKKNNIFLLFFFFGGGGGSGWGCQDGCEEELKFL